MAFGYALCPNGPLTTDRGVISESAGTLQNIVHLNDDSYILQSSGSLYLFRNDYTKIRDMYIGTTASPVIDVFYDKTSNMVYALIPKNGQVCVMRVAAGAAIPTDFEANAFFKIPTLSTNLIIAVDTSAGRNKIFILFPSTAVVKVYNTATGIEYVNEPEAWATLPGDIVGRLNTPTDMDIDVTNGNVFISDSKNHRIQVFATDGTPLAVRIGKYNVLTGTFNAGSDAGHFRNPGKIYVKGDQLYVIDSGNFRVQRLNVDGTPVMQFGVTGLEDKNFGNFAGISVNSLNKVFVVDAAVTKTKIYYVLESPSSNVSNLTVSNVLAGQATITFAAVERAAWYTAFTENGATQYGSSNTNSITIGGLRGGSNYTVVVRAYNDAGASPGMSPTTTFLTPPETPSLLSVLNSETTETSATIAWISIGEVIDDVIIEWHDQISTTYDHTVTVPYSSGNTYRFDNVLTASTKYYVRVKLRNSAGSSAGYATVELNTGLDTIKNLKVDAILDVLHNDDELRTYGDITKPPYYLSTSMAVTFDPPTNTNAKYIRFYINEDYTTPVHVTTKTNNQTDAFHSGRIVLTFFKPAKTYTLQAKLASSTDESLPVTALYTNPRTLVTGSSFTMEDPAPVGGFDLLDEWQMEDSRVICSDFTFEASPDGTYTHAANAIVCLSNGTAFKVNRWGVPLEGAPTEGNGMATIAGSIAGVTIAAAKAGIDASLAGTRQTFISGLQTFIETVSWSAVPLGFTAVSVTQRHIYIMSKFQLSHMRQYTPSGSGNQMGPYTDTYQSIVRFNLTFGEPEIVAYVDGVCTGMMARWFSDNEPERVVFCSPSSNKVYFVDVEGAKTVKVACYLKGSEPGWIKQPYGVAIDDTKAFYVSEQGNHRVQKFIPYGSGYASPYNMGHLDTPATIGKESSGDIGDPVATNDEDGFNAPQALSMDKFNSDPDYYVYDSGTKRIKTFKWSSGSVKAFGSTGYGSSVITGVSWLSCDELMAIVCDPAASGARTFEKKYSPTSTLPTNQIVVDQNTTAAFRVSWADEAGHGIDDAKYYQIFVDGFSNPFMTQDLRLNLTHTAPTGAANRQAFAPGTKYAVRIAGANAAGAAPISDPVYALTVPAAPTGLTMVANSATESSIKMTWSNSGGPAVDGVRIFCYAISAEALADIPSTSGKQAEITGLTSATQYQFVARAYNSAGESVDSAAVGMNTKCGSPTNVRVTNITNIQATLVWDAVNTAISYNVTIEGGNQNAPINTLTPSLVVPNLTAGKKYFARVQATNQSGDSALSEAVTILTTPTAPTGIALTFDGATTTTLSVLRTTNGGDYVDKIDVYVRERGDQPVTTITTVADSVVTLSGLNPSSSYHVYMIAENASGRSAASAEVEMKTLCEAPTNLLATGITARSLVLTWNSVSTATAYLVNISGGTTRAETVNGANRLTVSNLNPATAYSFSVMAINSSGQSEPSAVLSSVMTLLEPITGFRLGAVTNSTIEVLWDTDGGSVISGFQVLDPLTSQIMASALLGPNRSITIIDLEPGSSHSYVLRAYNISGIGPVTGNTVSATTKFLPPTGLQILSTGFDNVSVQWDLNENATSYRVTCNGVTATTTSNTHNFNGLSDDTKYNISVVQANSGGESDAAVIEALTKPLPPALSIDPTDVGSSVVSVRITPSHAINNLKTLRIYVNNFDTAYVDQLMSDIGSKFTVSGLTPNQPYQIRVRVLNDSGMSELSAIVTTRTKKAVPTKPVNLGASGVTSSAFRVIWDTTVDADVYRVLGLGANPVDVTTGYFDALGLNPATVYNVQVAAVNESGVSPYSDVLTVTTKLAPPANITIDPSMVSFNSLTIRWTNPNGNKDIHYKIFGNGDLLKTITDRAITETEIAGLIDDTDYSFTMTCEMADASEISLASTPILTRTKIAIPAKPTGLDYSVVTTSSFRLFWDNMAKAASYKVYGFGETPIDCTTNELDITGKPPGAVFNVSVTAVNASGASPYSDTLVAATKIVPPANITFDPTRTTDISALIRWTNPNSDRNVVYKILVGGSVVKTITDKRILETNVTGLSDANVYSITMACEAPDNSEVSATSAPVTALTRTSAPTGIVAYKISNTSVKLMWNPVFGANSYKIYGATYQPIETTEPFKIMTGLVFTSEYTLYIVGINETGESVPSAIYNFRISELPYDLMTLTLDEATDNSLILTWSEVAGNTGYKVFVDDVQRASGLVEATYTVPNLTMNTFYKVRVATEDAVGVPLTSRDLYCKTTGQHLLKARLNSGNPDPITTNSVDLVWDPIPGATSYKLYVGTTLVTTVQTTDVVQELVPGASSVMTIEAIGAGDAILDTSAITVVTDLAAPSGLFSNTTEATATTIALHWVDDGGLDAVVGFRVYKDAELTPCKQVIKGLERTIEITDLQPLTTYTFSIAGYNEAMESPKSNVVSIRTKAV